MALQRKAALGPARRRAVPHQQEVKHLPRATETKQQIVFSKQGIGDVAFRRFQLRSGWVCSENRARARGGGGVGDAPPP